MIQRTRVMATTVRCRLRSNTLHHPRCCLQSNLLVRRLNNGAPAGERCCAARLAEWQRALRKAPRFAANPYLHSGLRQRYFGRFQNEFPSRSGKKGNSAKHSHSQTGVPEDRKQWKNLCLTKQRAGRNCLPQPFAKRELAPEPRQECSSGLRAGPTLMFAIFVRVPRRQSARSLLLRERVRIRHAPDSTGSSLFHREDASARFPDFRYCGQIPQSPVGKPAAEGGRRADYL